MTFRAARAILRASMRRTLLIACLALATSAALAGCSNACQDLGDRLCGCVGGGTARDTCKQQIKNQLKAAGVTSADDARCTAALNTCNAPAGAQFCEWVNTSCGKASCGLSNQDPADPLVCAPAATP